MKFSVSYWKRSLLIFAAGAGIVLYGITGFAQSSSSGVNGVVTDPNGAVVPGASVALVNVATNVERNTVSNASGNYFFAEVPPARYTLMFTAKGFEKESIAPFDVAVAQVVTVNAALKVGSCLVPRCDGVKYEQLPSWEVLWDRYFMGAPERQRQFVERYKIVKRA